MFFNIFIIFRVIILKKNNRLSELKQKRMQKEEYAYDFVPELSHVLNVDEQRVKARELENITKDKEK